MTYSFDGEERVNFIILGKFELLAHKTKSINQGQKYEQKFSPHPFI